MLAALAEVFPPIKMIFFRPSWRLQRTACTSKFQVLWAGIDICSVRGTKLYYFVTAASITPHCVQLSRWEHSLFRNVFTHKPVGFVGKKTPKCLLMYFLYLDASLSSNESFRLLLILFPPSSEAKPFWSCMFNYASLLLPWKGFFLNSLLEVTSKRLDPLVEMETCPHCYLCQAAFCQMATMQRSSGRQAAEKKKRAPSCSCVCSNLSPSNRHPTAVLHEAN